MQPADRQVGARLRTRRHELGISQTKLADAVSLTFQQIQKYEKGANRIGASRLQQFANILKVPASYFFENSSFAFSPRKENVDASLVHISQFIASAEGRALVKAFGRINDSMLRNAIARFVEQLARSLEN